MESKSTFDAQTRPPDTMRILFKHWHKSSLAEIEESEELIDFSRDSAGPRLVSCILSHKDQNRINEAMKTFLAKKSPNSSTLSSADSGGSFKYFQIKDLPGLFVFPSLLSPDLQFALLDKVFHRDLSNPTHQTNIHLHYNVSYPLPTDRDAAKDNAQQASFFTADTNLRFEPKNPILHTPLGVDQMLHRKLRWMTLGGQYNWTSKEYPNEPPPSFPSDIAHLLKGFFPDVDAQAAIVNVYSPGDTLSVHRDVSEECDKGLVSLSIGCDGIFIIGNEDGTQRVTLILRSGDALVMSGASRFAWHAVPRILPNTCPPWLESWPAVADAATYDRWRGWMRSKRININVRQMTNKFA